MTLHDHLTPGRYKLRVEDYARLGDDGVFGDAPTELIAGEIIVMSPEWRPHMRIKDEIAYRLRRALEGLDSHLAIGTGGSLAIDDNTMPRPDIVLTSELDGEHAVPARSVALVVEVSATTLGYDADGKAAMYASAGIAEYWIADIAGRTLHRLWLPEDGAYAQRDKVAFGQKIAAATIDGLTITLPEG